MRTLRLILVGSLGLGMLACGGAPPIKSGYPDGEASPWSKAGTLRLNDNMEAMAEGELSYPDNRRARWYAIELPAAGKITARVSTESSVKGADIGMEVLDAGYNVNVEGQNDDDMNQAKKVREYKDARQGKSYIHLYALGRNDVVAYTLRVRFEPKPQTARVEPSSPSGPDKSVFPWTVPSTPVLPQIGKGGGGSGPTPPPTPPDPNAGFNVIQARVIEFSSVGGGVRIIVNKGQNQNLAEGLEGDIVSGGKPIKGAHFKIKSCHADDCEATAPSATMDMVQANRAVVIKIPK